MPFGEHCSSGLARGWGGQHRRPAHAALGAESQGRACSDPALPASLPPPCLPEKTLEPQEAEQMGSRRRGGLAQTQLLPIAHRLQNHLLQLGLRSGLNAGQGGNAQAWHGRASLPPVLITAAHAELLAPRPAPCAHAGTSPRAPAAGGESSPRPTQVGRQRLAGSTGSSSVTRS